MDIVSIGSVNVDLVANVGRFPRVDDEVAVKRLETLGGGSAANVAVGVARLGHSAGFVGLVGTDSFGDFLIKEFEKEGVDISRVKRIEGSSGLVFAAVNQKGERVLYASDGVGTGFSKEHVPLEYIKDARFLHLTSIDGEQVLEAFELAAKTAREAGVKVVFDPGCIFAEKGLEIMKNIMKHCFIFKANRLETERLTHTEDEKAVEKLLETGAEKIIITKGLEGCIIGNKDRIKRMPLAPKKKVKTIDLTGAGDSFSAGLLAALLENNNLDKGVEFAMQIGHISTCVSGARGTPKRAEVEKMGLII